MDRGVLCGWGGKGLKLLDRVKDLYSLVIFLLFFYEISRFYGRLGPSIGDIFLHHVSRTTYSAFRSRWGRTVVLSSRTRSGSYLEIKLSSFYITLIPK